MKSDKPIPPDLTEFREKMHLVTPLKTKKTVLKDNRVKAKVRKKHIIPTLPVLTEESFPEVSADETLFFARTGLQHKVIKKLKNGEFPVKAELDLHGLTVAEAEKALRYFIAHCTERHYQCVRIIHGKGSSITEAPKLKNKVNSWLRQIPAVLAFCSAGAVCILLKM